MNRGLGFWLAAGAATLVVLAIVAGLATVGGPGAARLDRLDAARLDDLRAIDRAAAAVWNRMGTVPSSLDSLSALSSLSPDHLIDPETGEPYTYRGLSDSTAEVCATFARESDASERYASEWSDIGEHPAGRHCFTLYPPYDR